MLAEKGHGDAYKATLGAVKGWLDGLLGGLLG